MQLLHLRLHLQIFYVQVLDVDDHVHPQILRLNLVVEIQEVEPLEMVGMAVVVVEVLMVELLEQVVKIAWLLLHILLQDHQDQLQHLELMD